MARQPGGWGLRGGQPGGWWLRGGPPLPGRRDTGRQPASVSHRAQRALSVSHPRVGGAAMAESLPLQAWAQAGPPARAHLSCRTRHPITQQVYKPGRQGTEASLTQCVFQQDPCTGPPAAQKTMSHVRRERPRRWLLHIADTRGNRRYLISAESDNSA